MRNSAYNRLMMFTLMGMIFDPSLGHSNDNYELSDEEKEHLKKQFQYNKKKLMLNKGLKEFTIDNITVIALNEKNAIRKIAKIKREIESLNHTV